MKKPIVPALTYHYNERRPRIIILHGTACDWQMTDDILRGRVGEHHEISSHYGLNKNGEITQYLDERMRAFHVGTGYWAGIDKDLNSLTAGIEIECISHDEHFNTAESTYTDVQIKSLIPLVQAIMSEYRIDAHNVLAHQDVNPKYKWDPGIHFPWQKLATHGIGIWHDLPPVKDDPVVTDQSVLSQFRRDLTFYGYTNNPEAAGENHENVIRAFQTHFLPWHICGQATEQSIAALDVLISKKYGSF